MLGLLLQPHTRHICNKSTQRAQTSANANMSIRIRNRIFGLIQMRMSVGSVPKCCGMWMHYLVNVSYIAKYGTNRPLIVGEMVTYVQTSPTLFRSGEENEKVITTKN